MGIGLGFAINLYFTTYFWEFSSLQIAGFTFSSLLAAVLAFAISPRIAQHFDKKPATMVLIPAGLGLAILPIILRLMHLFPANGSPVLYPLIFAIGVVAEGIGICGSILFTSMIADVVEDSELKTGRRQEGLFFAAAAFVNKAVTGAGIFFAAMIVGLIHFPEGAKPGTVPAETLRNLGLVYIPIQVVLYGLTLLLLIGYRISRASHAETLRKLAAAADLAVEGEPASVEAKLG
jgi:Na+/melibiose symporter-like transporter